MVINIFVCEPDQLTDTCRTLCKKMTKGMISQRCIG